MSVGVIIAAAGSGTRLGESTPKAFVGLAGHTILEVCVAGVRAAGVGTIVVVVPDSLVADAAQLVPGVQVVAGGADRSASVRAGVDALDAADPDVDLVLVHDAARPMTPAVVFSRVIDAVRAGHPVVIPGMPVTDTLKAVDPDGATPDRVLRTVDRTPLRAVQTPQGFTREALRRAHSSGADDTTDYAGLAERAGLPVEVVVGDPLAMKITTQWDLRIARTLMAQAHAEMIREQRAAAAQAENAADRQAAAE